MEEICNVPWDEVDPILKDLLNFYREDDTFGRYSSYVRIFLGALERTGSIKRDQREQYWEFRKKVFSFMSEDGAVTEKDI